MAQLLRDAHFGKKGGVRTFAAICTNGCNADKAGFRYCFSNVRYAPKVRFDPIIVLRQIRVLISFRVSHWLEWPCGHDAIP
jgi:hypothetical protein